MKVDEDDEEPYSFRVNLRLTLQNLTYVFTRRPWAILVLLLIIAVYFAAVPVDQMWLTN